jgi:maleate cis-trans isomerase
MATHAGEALHRALRAQQLRDGRVDLLGIGCLLGNMSIGTHFNLLTAKRIAH